MFSNVLNFKFLDKNHSSESIAISVPIPEDAHASYIVHAFEAFMRAMSYSDITIEKYINTEAVFDDWYNQTRLEEKN